MVVELVGGGSGVDCCSRNDGGNGSTAITRGMLDMVATKGCQQRTEAEGFDA